MWQVIPLVTVSVKKCLMFLCFRVGLENRARRTLIKERLQSPAFGFLFVAFLRVVLPSILSSAFLLWAQQFLAYGPLCLLEEGALGVDVHRETAE